MGSGLGKIRCLDGRWTIQLALMMRLPLALQASKDQSAEIRLASMRTYPIYSTDRILFAFEIDHVYVSRRNTAKLLKSSALVADVNLRGHFGSSDDVRVKFNYLGRDFILLEPYGDNSRYWIGPEEPGDSLIDVADLKEIFDAHRPSPLRSIIGDIANLKIFRRP